MHTLKVLLSIFAEKSTHLAELVSNTCDHLTSTPCLPAVCSAEVTQVHPMICPPQGAIVSSQREEVGAVPVLHSETRDIKKKKKR